MSEPVESRCRESGPCAIQGTVRVVESLGNFFTMPPPGKAARGPIRPLPWRCRLTRRIFFDFARANGDEAQAVEKLLKGRGCRAQLHTGADASEETLRSASRPRLLYCITHGFFLEDRPRPAAPNPLRELALADAGPTKWTLPDPGPDPSLASDGQSRHNSRKLRAAKWSTSPLMPASRSIEAATWD
jgi:hypothetical protein